MRGVRLFLVPTWTELEWSIRPQLEDWAEVASYDPIRSDDPDAVSREMFVDRGLDELERLGWDGFFVVGDTFGTATAARIARARRDAVRGIALGHACVSWDMDGDRPPVKRELWAAMGQPMSRDAASFVRHGSPRSPKAPTTRSSRTGWSNGCRAGACTRRGRWSASIVSRSASSCARSSPLLLAKHKGCLVFTDEGFEDIRTAFPDARTVAVERPPSADEEFGHALREFCLQA
jgi:hypothetical protein